MAPQVILSGFPIKELALKRANLQVKVEIEMDFASLNPLAFSF